MAKDPAVLFYTQDFLVGSSMLTPLQKGHYITLLCHQQQSATGSLKVEEIKILMGKDFDKHWFFIAHKFEADGNGFFNKRMRLEIEKRKAYSESRRKNRLKDDNNICKTYDSSCDNHMEIRNRNKKEEVEIEIKEEDEIEKKRAREKWNTNPAEHEQQFLTLTPMEFSQCEEYIFRIKQQQLTPERINDFWEAFKIQQFTGGKFYQTRSDCVDHFRNWLKKHDDNFLNNVPNGKNGKHQRAKPGSTAAAAEWLKRGRN